MSRLLWVVVKNLPVRCNFFLFITLYQKANCPPKFLKIGAPLFPEVEYIMGWDRNQWRNSGVKRGEEVEERGGEK